MTIMLSCKLRVLKDYQPASFKGHENYLIKIQKVDTVHNQKRQREKPSTIRFVCFFSNKFKRPQISYPSCLGGWLLLAQQVLLQT